MGVVKAGSEYLATFFCKIDTKRTFQRSSGQKIGRTFARENVSFDVGLCLFKRMLANIGESALLRQGALAH